MKDTKPTFAPELLPDTSRDILSMSAASRRRNVHSSRNQASRSRDARSRHVYPGAVAVPGPGAPDRDEELGYDMSTICTSSPSVLPVAATVVTDDRQLLHEVVSQLRADREENLRLREERQRAPIAQVVENESESSPRCFDSEKRKRAVVACALLALVAILAVVLSIVLTRNGGDGSGDVGKSEGVSPPSTNVTTSATLSPTPTATDAPNATGAPEESSPPPSSVILTPDATPEPTPPTNPASTTLAPTPAMTPAPTSASTLPPTPAPTPAPTTPIPTPPPTSASTPPPTPPSTPEPSTTEPTQLPNPPPTQGQALMTLIADASPDNGEAANDPSTPQGRAFAWLVGNANLASYTDQQKIQRYVLATLYYSTDGESWFDNTGWLSDDSECNWFNEAFEGCIDDTLVSLELYVNNLQGTIPREISMLSDSLGKSLLKSTYSFRFVPNSFTRTRLQAFAHLMIRCDVACN